MPVRPSLIIDNTALVNFTDMKSNPSLFSQLKNLFHTVYISQAVHREYEIGLKWQPERQWLLSQVGIDRGFYRFCTSYDSVVKSIASTIPGMDFGEAESYAQFRMVNAHFILTDDVKFTKSLLTIDRTITVFNSIHILCWLNIAGLLTDWHGSVSALYSVRPFTSKELRSAYTDILKRLGVNINKKLLQQNCGLKKILK